MTFSHTILLGRLLLSLLHTRRIKLMCFEHARRRMLFAPDEKEPTTLKLKPLNLGEIVKHGKGGIS